MLATIVIAYATAITIINSINPTLERQSRVIAKSLAEKVSNEAMKEAMQGVKYEDLCNIEKDSDGNIKMMNLNVITVNNISSKIALKMQQDLKNNEKDTVSISLGSLTGNKILAGRGPKIHVKITTMGAVQTSVKSELTEVRNKSIIT